MKYFPPFNYHFLTISNSLEILPCNFGVYFWDHAAFVVVPFVYTWMLSFRFTALLDTSIKKESTDVWLWALKLNAQN